MKKFILLGSALLGASFLAAGCSQLPTSQTKPTTSTPVTQETPQPTTTEQKTDEVGVPVTDESGALKIYQNQEYGFEFKYPKEWKTQSNNIMANLGEKDFIGFTSGFAVSVWDTSSYSVDDLKAAPPGGIDPDSVKETKTVVDSHPATETSYTLVKDTESGSNSGKKILIQKDNLVYLIEGTAEECATIVPTFKFIK